MATEVIDAFAHVLPRRFFDEMERVHPTDELKALSEAPRFWDMDIRLELFDQYGIDRQVLTLARPPIWRGIDESEALRLTELANDTVRDLADEYEEFIPVATLPFVGEPYLTEFERCLEMDMVGVQIFSNVEGQPIDSPDHQDLFSLAVEQNVPIWLHPQLHTWQEWDSRYMLHKMLGWPFDTSLALCRLVFSGIMGDYPNLTVIPHHMGGMIPHFIDRIELFHQMAVEHPDVYPYEVRDLRGQVRDRFSLFYGDTCRSGDSSVLEDGLDFFGEDRLVFATDYPFGPDEGERFMAEEVKALEGLDVEESTRAAVSGKNLRAII